MFIPISFLFHHILTISSTTAVITAYGGTVLFIIFAGLISIRTKIYLIIPLNIFNIWLSVRLGAKFITPPDESWFYPFRMNFAIISVGVFVLIGVLIVRFVARILLLRAEKQKNSS